MVKKKSIYPYLLVAPALIIILCVVFIPVVNAIGMSFQSYDLRRPNDIAFVGLANYIAAFKDELFWKALWKTIIWVVFGVGFQFVFGFILALLLNKKFRGRGVVRAVSLIPWVTPGILIGLMWRWMYDGNYGVLNDILQKLHIINKSIPFLAQANTAFLAVVVTIIWQGIPFFANSVDVIFNMTEGGPAYATQTLSVYVFNKAQALNLGYSSAMAILLALVLCLVAVPYLIFTFREEDK